MQQSDPLKLGNQQHLFELFSCDRKWGNPLKNTGLLDEVIPGNCEANRMRRSKKQYKEGQMQTVGTATKAD